MISKKLHKLIYQSTEAGYTLMESMVAMVLVSILAVSISPMLGFWVASRVQARRVELGAVAARAYIDGVRAEVINHPDFYLTNPTLLGEGADVSTLVCEQNNDYCTQPTLTNQGQFFCVNNDDTSGCQVDSATDIVLHVGSFSPSGAFYQLDSNNNPRYELGYKLDVRAYQAAAFSEPGKLLRSSSTKSQVSRVSGLADKKAPLVEISTEITTGETNYFELENLLQ
ncbi:MAG: type II secretion system protein [Okeania sp. SIO3B5]|uniref:hormogonium polysaccharide secretion pseudopilin HpsB n=1 Tax=Okeania sp. SIO3B5 TaxID=2607811 RepID=UPI0013FFA351|nr:hormogonium polysaccharide secretion pseudopilin HpsB [Okeania sp. SIO3B5]NEO56047.1 type II secretion system protein [Okeania sp. SIO3B5]